MTSLEDDDFVPEATVAVVSPVMPQEQSRRETAEEPSPLFDDPNKEFEERRLRRELYLVLALAFMIVTIVVVTVSVVATAGKRKHNTRHQTKSPTLAPTMAPTLAITTEQARLDYVRSALAANNFTSVYLSKLPKSASQLQSNDKSPIAKATNWLVHQDRLVNEQNIMRRLALATIYYSNNGAHWKNTTNWLSATTTHCDWFGVTCCSASFLHGAPTCDNVTASDPDSLVDLNLSGNRLSGTMTPIFTQLTDLRSLDLSFNSFTGTCQRVVVTI
jgi:hypothetical protein